MRTGTSFEAGCFHTSAELGLFQEKSFGSVCTAASLVLALAYGVYKISSFFERGSTNIHSPAGLAICRALSTSGSLLWTVEERTLSSTSIFILPRQAALKHLKDEPPPARSASFL